MDPYAQYHQEISAAIISLATLHQSYNRLLSTTPPPQHSSSQPISYALAELRATITALQLDLEELDESVEALEKDPEIARRLGLGGEVVRERREFVDSINRRVNAIQRTLPTTDSSNSRQPPSSGYPPSNAYPNNEDAEGDSNEQFERQHQTLLVQQQDQTLTEISGTVEQLRAQAKVMGQEVFDQNIMLDDLDGHVETTSTRLNKAQRKLQRFVRDNQSSPSSWCILILIIVLTLLLVTILFF